MKKKKNLLQENMKRFKTKNLDHINEHILGELPSQKLMKMKWNPLTEAVELKSVANKIKNVLPKYDYWKSTYVPKNMIPSLDNDAIAITRGKKSLGNYKLMGVVEQQGETDLFKVRVSKEWDSTLGLRKYDPTLLINGLLPNESDTIDWIKNNFGTAPKLPTDDSETGGVDGSGDAGVGGTGDTGVGGTGTSGDGEEIYDTKPSGGFCKRNLDLDWYFDNIITGKSYLKQGDCGVAVETAQSHTNEFTTGDFASDGNFGPVKVDGMYGPQTRKYIRQVQDFLNLKPDGLYGQKTHDALINAIKNSKSMKIDPRQPEKNISQLRVDAPIVAADNNEFQSKAKSFKERRKAARLKRLKFKQGKLKKKIDKLMK